MASQIAPKGRVLNVVTSGMSGGAPELPSPSDMYIGEICINYLSGKTQMSTKDSSGLMAKFSCDDYIFQQFDTRYYKAPVVVYETDGTSGLLGENKLNNIDISVWDLENLNLSGFSFLKCYVKEPNEPYTGNSLSPSLIFDIDLDSRSLSNASGTKIFLGGGSSIYPNDRNRIFTCLACVDETKTKFKFLREQSLYGTAVDLTTNNGKYLYKIEGWY